MVKPAFNTAIIFDVDYVLLDYCSRLREYVNKRDGKCISGEPCAWDTAEWLQLDSREELMETLYAFSHSFEFGTLDIMPGSDVVLNALRKDGHSLIALTACGTHEITMALRKVNLYHSFGDIFDEVHCVNYTDSKADILKGISSRYNVIAFVDDKPENILDAFYGAGIENNILMCVPHNEEFRMSGVQSIANASDMYCCKRLIDKYISEVKL